MTKKDLKKLVEDMKALNKKMQADLSAIDKKISQVDIKYAQDLAQEEIDDLQHAKDILLEKNK